MQLNISQIQKILPHRYPFLLIDRITDMEEGKWASGIKCISAGEMQFLGHFPDYPVMPGVLIIEALAQTGAVALLSEPENRGKLAMFGGVRNCRFKREVLPGDVLELYCEIESRRGPMGFGKAIASVGSEIVAQARLSFVIKDSIEK
ncbi:3-hydroxyacyl-ACP dehydratase FabZ [Hornefia butyriciproducens]|uniref:3-hydroxyacyl-ACP dehydratase FabZ n=1 Tax=Hornefia butyriciproducens TaxID=2652293 RepID=UPI0023EF7DA5|nr:3-hydroxyacyl-ACP dehydratase FabZ [Hornefia butyriciproducens]MDD6298897.1 3-hydroxyacyl-ACP dehydratase FabZ [Hornefia butyriciproducens]